MGWRLSWGQSLKIFLKTFFLSEVQVTYIAHIVSIELNQFLQTVYTHLASIQIKHPRSPFPVLEL